MESEEITCPVCFWIVDHDCGEVELCKDCNHYFLPYVHDCGCGIHEIWKGKEYGN